MSPLSSPDGPDEQSEAERRAIARRYRAKRGEQLTELARRAGIEAPQAVGEFASVPLEDLAAIPLVGAAAAAVARLKGHRHGLPNQLLLAIDANGVHALERRAAPPEGESGVRVVKRWDRGSIRVEAVRKQSLKTAVSFTLEGEDKPLVLYTTSLQLNPWSADVVSLLGGEVPPLLLTDDATGAPGAPGGASPRS